ncbi:MAG: MFS transporter [Anaerolineales bacterium]|nr:MFS transporter [Anaerolineales bacterium]
MNTPKPPLLNVNLRWFLLGMILANIAGQMVYSMLSLYLVELGASVGQVGLVFTVASLVPMALQILGGWLSDTIGRLRTIALGSVVAVFGYLLFMISPSWEWVMIGLCVEFVSNSMVGPSFNSYIAEQSDEGTRGRVFGLTSSIYMIVTVIGPAMAGFLAYRFNFRLMLMVALIFYAAATGVRIWMATAERFAPLKEAQKPTLGGLKTQMVAMFALLFGGGLLTWIWITDAVGDIAYNLIGQLYPIYLSELGKMNLEQIGVLNAAWGLATIVAGYLAGWLTDRSSERTMIASGFLIQALGLVVLLQARSYPAFLAAMLIFGFGVGSLMPAYQTLISKAVPEERRGLAFGFFGTSIGILSLPFPWVGAQLWERFSPQTPFWITVIACIISIPIAWYKFILPKIKEGESTNNP